VDCLRVGRGRVDVRKRGEIVQGVGETRHQLRLRSHPGLGALLGRGASCSLVLSGEAQVAVFELVALRLEPRDCLVGGLDGEWDGRLREPPR